MPSPPRLVARGTALLPIALAPLLACGGEPAEEPPPPLPPPAAEAPRELTPDERLAEDVRDALALAPALQTENIRIAVAQGQVFLAGEVSAPHLRDEAVAIAGDVPGVRGVQSKINVGRRGRSTDAR